MADQTNDEGLQLACRGPYITALFHAGRLKEALLCAEYVLEQGSQDARLGADIFGYSPYIFALWIRALISLRMGRCHDAEANLDRAVRLARQHGEAENLCWASTVYVSLARISGHSEGALVHARNAVEIAEKTASPLSRVVALSSS